MKKVIIRVLIIQILIILSFFLLLNMSRPVNITTSTQCNIVVEEIDYGRGFNESRLYVYDQSIGYMFSKGAIISEYSGVYEISKQINEGDILTITYIEESTLFGKRNLVVDAFSQEGVYLSYHQYNADKQIVRIALYVSFAIFELIFIAISVFIIRLHSTNKHHNRKIKKKKEKEKQQNI